MSPGTGIATVCADAALKAAIAARNTRIFVIDFSLYETATFKPCNSSAAAGAYAATARLPVYGPGPLAEIS
jgi:hypothetical protein